MFNQVSRMAWLSSPAQILGARANRKVHLGQFARNQSGILQFTDADREVDIFFDQVELTVIQIDLDFDLGMPRQKSLIGRAN